MKITKADRELIKYMNAKDDCLIKLIKWAERKKKEEPGYDYELLGGVWQSVILKLNEALLED